MGENAHFTVIEEIKEEARMVQINKCSASICCIHTSHSKAYNVKWYHCPITQLKPIQKIFNVARVVQAKK